MTDDELKAIEARANAALEDTSFVLRVNLWLTAGDGRQFCASAITDIPALIHALREERQALRAAREALRIAADRLEGVSIAIEKHGQDITPSFFIVEYSKYAIEARKALAASTPQANEDGDE